VEVEEVTGQACLGLQEVQELLEDRDGQGVQAFLEALAAQGFRVFRLLPGALAYQVHQAPQDDQDEEEADDLVFDWDPLVSGLLVSGQVSGQVPWVPGRNRELPNSSSPPANLLHLLHCLQVNFGKPGGHVGADLPFESVIWSLS